MSSSRPLKRQRINRACDQCRGRKSKCDGEQPACSICRSANRSCTYQSGGGRRGLPSGYVRSLEIVLGLMFQHVPNGEAITHGVLRDYRGKGNLLTGDMAEHSLQIWRKSKVYRDLSQLLATGSEDLAIDDLEEEPIKTRDHESIDDHGSPALVSRPTGVSASCEMPIVSCESRSLPVWAVPDNTPDLLDFYFTYTHCWFPILERRELLRAMHIGSSQSNFELTPSQTLLWSVIAHSCVMKGIRNSGLPTLPAIQLYTQRPLVSDMCKIELAHLQSTLIVALTHISMGNINQAWVLLGQAARMLAILPLNHRKGRFTHTFNGCVFLDNIVSSLLGRTSCFSPQEQLQQGPVDQDDVDEWDVWSASRARTLATPLQALSTFNSIRHLTQHLSQISYCTPNTAPVLEEFIDNLRQQQSEILQHRPYSRGSHATPPLLTLHLTSAFTTLSMIRKLEQTSPAILDLCIKTIQHTLDMLDHYVEITGRAGSSPLVHCFALQCQGSLDIATPVLTPTNKKALETHIHAILQLEKPDCRINRDWLEHAVDSVSAAQYDEHNASPIPTPLAHNTPVSQANLAILAPRPEPPDIPLPAMPSTSDAALSVGGGPEEYDALFEELMLVGSFPFSRQEPAFAHNLGFYDGDLGVDFLAQLQQPPLE
ncbi:hypothetical protein PENFLA_c026G06799 [Penicillium flavigenum]|uniref:Zn(2)-C6 fungal-type domain-containing protein n=1 Tax=Penicillium flavigenum TaxID=254877 RepID=A0A1V6SS79_9EURO|nr:hypothetical protein PENFLA_c026G06799 [Penicillium flavigenum]